jgi:hypothetical protein
MEEISDSCAHCGHSEVELKCGNLCGTVYCSEECGIQHWKIEHKLECKDILIGRKNEKKRGGKRPVSREKAREILHHGTAHGHPLTEQQRKYFDYWSNP